jgi:hypothetical protein
MATPQAFRAAQRAHVQANNSKQIPGTMIVARFVNALNQPPNIPASTSLNDLLKGGLVKWDLGLTLMSFPSFKRDGLILQKSDVMNANTVGDLGNLVFAWYRANGWTVT